MILTAALIFWLILFLVFPWWVPVGIAAASFSVFVALCGLDAEDDPYEGPGSFSASSDWQWPRWERPVAEYVVRERERVR